MGVCAVDDSTWLESGTSKSQRPLNADIYANNTCITASGDMYHYSHCSPSNLGDTTDNSFGNHFLSGAKLSFACGTKEFTLDSFQAAGHEKGSTSGPLPSAVEIAELGRKLLGIAA